MTWLEDGAIAADRMRDLFAAASDLHRLAPWTFADNDQTIAVDVPALRVHDACLAVLGARDDGKGLVLFDAFTSYDDFGLRPGDVTGYLLSLNFEEGDALPSSMRDEARAFGWAVDDDAHPVVLCLRPDGERRPNTEADVALATACTRAVVPLLQRHADVFRTRQPTRVLEELADLRVRLRAPHPDARRRVACACGSGRTFAGCHLREDPTSPERAYKRAHYAAWPRRALPALGGRTPQRAVRTADGRTAVEGVLAILAAAEDAAPSAERVDLAPLRATLGLP